MAMQGLNIVLLVSCFIHLVLSQSFGPVSTSYNFSSVYDDDDDYYYDDTSNSKGLTQNSGQLKKSELSVFCSNGTMKVILPSGSLSRVNILGNAAIESVTKAPAICGYSLTQGHDHNVLIVDYNGCHVTLEKDHYTLRVLYPNEAGKLDFATLSCKANQKLTPSLKPFSVQSKGAKLPPTQPSQSLPPTHLTNVQPMNSKPGGCSISADRRVLCSISGIMQDECLTRRCCFDAITSVCYYPMNECTADKKFVFAVNNDFTNTPVNPMNLMVAGKTGCKPVIANNNFAIFKFSVTECGTHSFAIGDTIIYLAEVQTVIKVRNLKYGMISRDNPIRLMIECRYPKDSTAAVFVRPVLASAGYMVMGPILPSYLLSEGLFGVQLLISEDETFTQFYPQSHQPLNVLLGKPVYLELRLKSPKPAATLLVHYCVAYPRSAKNALVLLFEGCPNPLDPGNTSILYVKDKPQNLHQRRFEIKAFQFMDLSNNKYLNEEIYFMCSTEVCMPSGSPCMETCFDGEFH